jgi:hypothetical protein
MMLFLVFDVPFHLLQIRLTHGKRAIARLPVELGVSGTVALGPFGASFLHLLNDLLQRMIPGKGKQRMNVILNSADRERGAIPFLIYPRVVREEFVAVRLCDPRLAVLRAEDQMNQVFYEGLRHCVFPRGDVSDNQVCCAPTGQIQNTAIDISLPQGVALGWFVAPLRGKFKIPRLTYLFTDLLRPYGANSNATPDTSLRPDPIHHALDALTGLVGLHEIK